ncbi:MAG: PTH1 family peptidyl-tRNA hydrolase [Myxococcota bacterium]|jgi:PTH1 family peptidyl-tRNA hydrolase
MVVDQLARWTGDGFRDKFKAHHAKGRLGNDDLHLLKPMTYMNVSGPSVGAAASFFKLPMERTIVIHDELDLPFGTLRLKVGGGHAGHNGLRSIFQHFGRDFIRLRCGIGRPQHGDVSNWVLSDFSADERISLDGMIEDAAKAIEDVLRDGALATMNQLNDRTR